MAQERNKQTPVSSSVRQITHTRLHDDGILETKYEILNKLGEGSFGTVFRVRNRESDLFYAMKTIPKKVKKENIFFRSNFFCLLFRLAGK